MHNSKIQTKYSTNTIIWTVSLKAYYCFICTSNASVM